MLLALSLNSCTSQRLLPDFLVCFAGGESGGDAVGQLIAVVVVESVQPGVVVVMMSLVWDWGIGTAACSWCWFSDCNGLVMAMVAMAVPVI